MWRKATLIAASAAIPFVLLTSSASASEYADTLTQPADGIYIPKTLTFLENMPYYVIPNTLKNDPEGTFAPQTVNVIEAESHWSGAYNWWKIHTDVGDRWVKTAPWQIEVPPPQTIHLMTETSLYASPSEAARPTASLSPQDVTVVGAEKNWYRPAEPNYNPMHWLKIHTTWLGDQWIHLHLDEIGIYTEMNNLAFYPGVNYQNSPFLHVITEPSDGLLTNIFVRQTGQFRSLLGSTYSFETEHGTKWAYGPGMLVQASQQTIKRTKPYALFKYPSAYSDIVSELPPGNLNVIETTVNDDGFMTHENWYHVQNDQAEGWFSPSYSEPEETSDDTESIVLHNGTTLIMRFPNSGIPLKNGQIGPQTLQPLAAWSAPDGTRWYKINSFVGEGWVQILPLEDNITLKGRENDAQIRSAVRYQGAFYHNDAGIFTFGTDTIGHLQNGEPQLSADFLAKQYQFKLTGPDANGWWSFMHTAGYGFQIKAGEQTAKTFWQGTLISEVNLAAAPAPASDAKLPPLLGLAEVRQLFGASTIYNDKVAFGEKHIVLSSREYEIAGFTLPAAVDGNRLLLSGLMYENTYMEAGTQSAEMTILVKRRDAAAGDPAEAYQAAVKRLYGLGMNVDVFDVTLDVPLQPGSNPLSVEIKVGERIVYKKDWEVTAPAAK
ncbi:hypothetical protein GQF01_13095 [Paenibacillus sp. 5J-6]|uniref:Copper amine oxidase-like N-terminal domain-containing protein n=1 Tax=Paenibacillus silvestris TaxID=2606219 RepID=A0A6L8UXT1_9BACL|nr:hypothetical protein [Paenibacillus silvestris]MZQ83043.1 hypothetical protein [Paenibacillus silvestris]